MIVQCGGCGRRGGDDAPFFEEIVRSVEAWPVRSFSLQVERRKEIVATPKLRARGGMIVEFEEDESAQPVQ